MQSAPCAISSVTCTESTAARQRKVETDRLRPAVLRNLSLQNTTAYLLLLQLYCTSPVTAAQLPPEILVDRHLIRVEQLVADEDYGAAHSVMNEIAALQQQHNLDVPHEFLFNYADVAFAAGLTQLAIDSLNNYLLAAGREGAFYREALELLVSAEDTLRRQEADRLRAEAERERAVAEQRAVDTLLRRQQEVAAMVFPRDALRSGGLGPEMVVVTRGRFEYEDGRWIEFDRPFAMSKYEVTKGEFENFVKQTDYRTDAEKDPKHGCSTPRSRPREKNSVRWNRNEYSQKDKHPVVCVSIYDGMAYAKWLSRETGNTYRLPSPEEWTYAARAGEPSIMPHYPDLSYSDSTGYYTGNACGFGNLAECPGGVDHAAEVGSFRPNAIGIHDMIGNVGELVMACIQHEYPEYFGGILTLAVEGLNRLERDPSNCGGGRVMVALGSTWEDFAFNESSIANHYVRFYEWLHRRPFPDWDSRARRVYRRNSMSNVGFRVVRDVQN